MPEIENPQQATETVQQELSSGLDAVKIYAQTWWDLNVKMPLDMVKAITVAAHRKGKLVFVHPSGSYGLEAAIDGGADILTHTTPSTGPWNKALLNRMKQAHLSLIPTLKLWRVELEKGGAPSGYGPQFPGNCCKSTAGLFSGWEEKFFLEPTWDTSGTMTQLKNTSK